MAAEGAWAAALNAMGEQPGVARCSEALGPAAGPVCVTGCNGFIALHVVSQLLEKGYTVHGTVRSTRDENKMAPLKELQQKYGEDKLKIIPGVDCLKPESFDQAVVGCVGVFHMASPFHYKTEDPMNDLVKPAKVGTESCLIACKKVGGVKRVVVTASFLCIFNFEAYPGDYTYSSKDWNTASQPDANGKFPDPLQAYGYSKIVAEKAAWDFAKAEDVPFDVCCINPSLVIGKNFNKCKTVDDLNNSSATLLSVLLGQMKPMPNSMAWVDVADVAQAHIVAYEHPEAGGRRFLCAASEVPTFTESALWLKEMAPACPVVTDPPEGGAGVSMVMDTSGLQKLGMKFTPLKETMKVQVESLVEAGFIPKP